ncbi:hypothetical protein I5677_00270 [Mobilitalea sibirica]|uniref:Lipoprotein n=1 Tax=Mobilitalea sibirica TaxID=1462919 RepID=A0A8J7H7B4_9FIRM|nr:hypothetical protein [Mobilitalea sibirica]MBH1939320.1 hypothetical protein [Mobilitalea sibirica]
MQKVSGKYMKITLSCMFVFLILFSAACLFISYKTGSEPNTLITCVFAFCGAEGGLSAWIKVTKEKKNKIEKGIEELTKDMELGDASEINNTTK